MHPAELAAQPTEVVTQAKLGGHTRINLHSASNWQNGAETAIGVVNGLRPANADAEAGIDAPGIHRRDPVA
jgi:hypothetical protein